MGGECCLLKTRKNRNGTFRFEYVGKGLFGYGSNLKRGQSVAGWLTDTIDGTLNVYGVELVDNVYEKTE